VVEVGVEGMELEVEVVVGVVEVGVEGMELEVVKVGVGGWAMEVVVRVEVVVQVEVKVTVLQEMRVPQR
jgi:hypothetical protein